MGTEGTKTQRGPGLILTSPSAGCVALHQLLTLSELSAPIHRSGKDACTTPWLQGFKWGVDVQCPSKGLARRRWGFINAGSSRGRTCRLSEGQINGRAKN